MNEGNTPQNEEAVNQPNWFSHQTENFSSLYFGKVPDHIAKQQDGGANAAQIANAVKLLTDPASRDIRHEVLDALKRNDARDFMVMLVEDKSLLKHRKALLTACWETGLDFSAYLINFARLVPDADLESCIEIATVIDEMHGPFEAAQLNEANSLLFAINDEAKKAILEPALFRLKSAQN
ncbi:MAG: hypothetical protein IM638_13675 [Bacteroidetes bacterium]|nr:hypothetical protein [Bacteroidota bacterium]